MFVGVVEKYGVVPKRIMPESQVCGRWCCGRNVVNCDDQWAVPLYVRRYPVPLIASDLVRALRTCFCRFLG